MLEPPASCCACGEGLLVTFHWKSCCELWKSFCNMLCNRVSSIWVRTKPYLWWWCYRKWSRAHAQPKMTSPEGFLTGSHGSDRVHMHGLFPRFFLTIVVVQNVGTRDRFGVSLWCARGREEEEVSLGVIMTNTQIFHIFLIFSLFNLFFFRISPIFSLSSIFSIAFHFSTYLSSIFLLSFHYSTDFSSIISR